MIINKHITYLLFCILLLVSISCSELRKNTPNVLIIITDDQGWGDISSHGNSVLQTPNLDKLACESVEFDRFYVSPVCAPTRASLLTGRYHLATGVSWVTHRKEVMRHEEVTLAEILKEKGYNTACFGKWHNGAQYPHNPLGQGFDTFFGFSAGHWNNYFDTKLEYNGKEIETKGYMPDVLTDSVLSYIDRVSRPFFVYLAYNTPHSPFQVPDKYFDKYKQLGLDDKNACIYGMCENIDDNVGRITRHLKHLGIDNNTITIFLGDNGPNGERYNGNLKGIKSHVDEGGIRVPFFIKYPDGKFVNRNITGEFAVHIDVLPTILDLCNISLPQNLQVHGQSFIPVLTDREKTLPKRYFYSHQVIKPGILESGAIRSEQYLVTMYPNDTSLFDLIADPYQHNDLSEQQPSVLEAFVANYQDWYNGFEVNTMRPQPVHIGYDTYPVTELPAHEAKLNGELKFSGGMGWANDWLTRFGDENDNAEWDVFSVEQARYKVILRYALNGNRLVTIALKNHGQQIKTNIEGCLAKNISSPDRVTRGEVHERKWCEVVLGELTFESGDNKLMMVAYDKEHRLEVKSIILKKIREHDEI